MILGTLTVLEFFASYVITATQPSKFFHFIIKNKNHFKSFRITSLWKVQRCVKRTKWLFKLWKNEVLTQRDEVNCLNLMTWRQFQRPLSLIVGRGSGGHSRPSIFLARTKGQLQGCQPGAVAPVFAAAGRH